MKNCYRFQGCARGNRNIFFFSNFSFLSFFPVCNHLIVSDPFPAMEHGAWSMGLNITNGSGGRVFVTCLTPSKWKDALSAEEPLGRLLSLLQTSSSRNHSQTGARTSYHRIGLESRTRPYHSSYTICRSSFLLYLVRQQVTQSHSSDLAFHTVTAVLLAPNASFCPLVALPLACP